MARVKIEGIKSLEKKLKLSYRAAIRKMLRSKPVRLEVGDIFVKDIKENVDFGTPSESTLKWRKRYDSLNQTDPAYKRNKIKGVFTGELFEDLKNNVKADTTQLSWEISHSKKKHKKYQGVTKKIGSRSSYQDISKGLVDKLGYDYFQLSSKGKNKILKVVKRELNKLI